jgi:hypothetical protein
MKTALKMRLFLVFIGFFALKATAAQAVQTDWNEEIKNGFLEVDRTVHRTVPGIIHYPEWLYTKPDHYEFSPLVSNADPQNDHPAEWDGQDWDPTQWNKNWTPQVAIHKFYQANIFKRQYMDGAVPTLELGPTFFKLSDLDRRRTLKLLMDTSAVFKKGAKAVKLTDWYSHDVVGFYTPKGMFLN